MTHRRQQALIDRHFSGTGTPGHEHEMREHLVTCADCRGHYERHLHLVALDPGGALPRDERLARGLGLAPTRAAKRASGRWLALALSASAACAFALVAIVAGRQHPTLQPRGTAASPGSQLLVYDVGRGRPAAVRQASSIRADSALAFAYANISHRRRLMVFAVDEERRVYWYHPGWEKPADNPVAVDIERDDAVHELPQAVTHRFSGRHLQLWGVFMDRPMSVREIEALVARAPADQGPGIRFDVAGADVTRLDLRLEADR
ncbi:MAG TPA: hypothetical protein VKQ32_15035 [Polyangia bacterium]|nr:hypothetical protein [Polyangia bacterium]